MFRRIYIKWLVWRGKAIDIWSKLAPDNPGSVLSNLSSNGFRFDGMVCGSMEGFLQSLKHQDVDKQRQICSMKGRNAKKRTTARWQTDQVVWWKGRPIDRQDESFRSFVKQAYCAMFEQNERFRIALMKTRGKRLFHSRGESNSFKTILTEKEFCEILTEIRDSHDHRNKKIGKVKFLGYGDVDGATGAVISITRQMIEGCKLVMKTNAGISESYHIAETIDKFGCGLKVVKINELEDEVFETIMEPTPTAPQKSIYVDGFMRTSANNSYILATDFGGEYYIELFKEDSKGTRTRLWSDYFWDK